MQYSIDILLSVLGIDRQTLVMRSGISLRSFYNLRSPDPDDPSSITLYRRVCRVLGIPHKHLVILKLIDRLAFLGGNSFNHKNFDSLLRDFKPELRRAVLERHPLFQAPPANTHIGDRGAA